MRKFYFLVDDIVKARFFISFMTSRVNNVEYECVFLTTKVSCYGYLKARAARGEVLLLLNTGTKNAFVDVDMSKTIGVLNKRQTESDAEKNYFEVSNSLYSSLKGKIKSEDYLFVFGGNHPTALAAEGFFNKQAASVLYLEISNLPNKMICDPIGVNAQSILFEQPQVIDKFSVIDEGKHKVWVNEYKEYKRKPIPQSKINVIDYLLIGGDGVLSSFGLTIKEDSLSFFSKLCMFVDKFRAKKRKSYGRKVCLENDYIFFPTQVSSDTQLKINSDLDNLDAISIICSRHKVDNIFVKIHPGESNIKLIDDYMDLQDRGLITIVSNDTLDLISKASKVYTINSTVGLEAMILNKDLEVLGRSIYSHFDDCRMKKYIHSYLLDLDYFGENEISKKIVDKIDYIKNIG